MSVYPYASFVNKGLQMTLTYPDKDTSLLTVNCAGYTVLVYGSSMVGTASDCAVQRMLDACPKPGVNVSDVMAGVTVHVGRQFAKPLVATLVALN